MAPSTGIPLLQLIGTMGLEGILITLLLALLSVMSLAVVLFKWKELRAVEQADEALLRHFSRMRSFEDLVGLLQRESPLGMGAVLAAAIEEARGITVDTLEPAALIQDGLERGIEDERSRLEERLVLLVMTAGLGPFLGLLGTVWGIMDAFWAIGQQGSANLNVVAPGIAEALLTTIAGLVVAIPAAAGHQLLTARVRRFESDAYSFAARVQSLFRRTAAFPGR